MDSSTAETDDDEDDDYDDEDITVPSGMISLEAPLQNEEHLVRSTTLPSLSLTTNPRQFLNDVWLTSAEVLGYSKYVQSLERQQRLCRGCSSADSLMGNDMDLDYDDDMTDYTPPDAVFFDRALGESDRLVAEYVRDTFLDPLQKACNHPKALPDTTTTTTRKATANGGAAADLVSWSSRTRKSSVMLPPSSSVSLLSSSTFGGDGARHLSAPTYLPAFEHDPPVQRSTIPSQNRNDDDATETTSMYIPRAMTFNSNNPLQDVPSI